MKMTSSFDSFESIDQGKRSARTMRTQIHASQRYRTYPKRRKMHAFIFIFAPSVSHSDNNKDGSYLEVFGTNGNSR